MKTQTTPALVNDPTAKPLCIYTPEELAEVLAYLATALDETVDAVFLARSDPGFLTHERKEDLRSLQAASRLLAEAAYQLIGGDK